MTPEAKARVSIDALQTAAGWHVSIIREAEAEAEADADANLKRAQALRQGTLVRAFALDQ